MFEGRLGCRDGGRGCVKDGWVRLGFWKGGMGMGRLDERVVRRGRYSARVVRRVFMVGFLWV